MKISVTTQPSSEKPARHAIPALLNLFHLNYIFYGPDIAFIKDSVRINGPTSFRAINNSMTIRVDQKGGFLRTFLNFIIQPRFFFFHGHTHKNHYVKVSATFIYTSSLRKAPEVLPFSFECGN